MRSFMLGAVVLVAALVSVGCNHMKQRSEQFNKQVAQARQNMNARTRTMEDNALLSDLSVAIVHFIPHTTELNSLGKQRLQRYAELLMHRGGTLYLDSPPADEIVSNARMQSIRDYLASAGIADDRIATEFGLKAGRGMAAVEAIVVKERAFARDQVALTDLLDSSGDFGAGN